MDVDDWLPADCEYDQQLTNQKKVSLLTQDSDDESDITDEVELCETANFRIWKCKKNRQYYYSVQNNIGMQLRRMSYL